MQYLERWILYHQYNMCDHRCDHFLGLYTACGFEVAGVAAEGVAVGKWRAELRMFRSPCVCRYLVDLWEIPLLQPSFLQL